MIKVYETMMSRFGRFVSYDENLDPYLNEIAPLMILWKLCGRGPIKISEHGTLVVSFLSIHGIYFTLSYGLLTYGIIGRFGRADFIGYFKSEDFSHLYKGSVVLTVVGLHFANVPHFVTGWSPLRDYAKEWAKLNVEYDKVMGSKFEYKFRLLVWISAVSLPFFGVLAAPPIVGDTFGTEWYHLIAPIVLFLSCTSELLILVFSCLELMIMGTKIHFKLKSLVKSKLMTAERVSDLRKLWLRCSHVARITGMSNPLQFIMDVAGSATMYCVASFALLSSLVTRDFDVTNFLVVIVCCWFRLFVLFEVGELTTNFIGSYIRNTISTLRIETLDVRVVDELDLFILNIYANYPEINVSGFISISRRVLFMIIAQANLYFFLLIQIRMAR